jgi:hypothetical protein
MTCGDSVDGAWNSAGVILFSTRPGLMQVAAAGGTPSFVTKRDESHKEQFHLHPVFLSDGKHFLYTRIPEKSQETGVFAGSLDSKPEDQSSKPVLPRAFNVAFVPALGSNPSQLLFTRDVTLHAQAFDAKRLQVLGDPVRIAEQVGFNNNFGMALFSASNNGTLVYKAAASANYQLTWFDRKGTDMGMVGEPGRFQVVNLASDGSRAAVSETDTTGNEDIWVYDFTTGSKTRFTFAQGPDAQPVWSPDRTKIAWEAQRKGKYQILQRASNGGSGEEVLFESASAVNLSEWSKDGKFILFHTSKPEVFALPVNGTHEAVQYAQGPGSQIAAHLSPDSRWVVYMSNESGKNELYVQGFDAAPVKTTGAKFMVSKGTLGMPRWRSDGKELLYLAPDGNVMSVDVTTSPVFHAGEPKPLFQVLPAFMKIPGNPGALVDMTADAKRFLFAIPGGGESQDELTVVLNWPAALKK